MPELITGGLGDPTDRGDPIPRWPPPSSAFAAGSGQRARRPGRAGHAPGCWSRSWRCWPRQRTAAAPAAGRVTRPGPAAACAREKTSEMALPTLVGSDGRRAVLAFTGLPSLTALAARRQAGARDRRARSGRPGPRRRARWSSTSPARCRSPSTAPGWRRWPRAVPPPLPHEDPDVRALADAALASEPLIAGFALLPGRRRQRPDDPGDAGPWVRAQPTPAPRRRSSGPWSASWPTGAPGAARDHGGRQHGRSAQRHPRAAGRDVRRDRPRRRRLSHPSRPVEDRHHAALADRGESHGRALVAICEGLPAGVEVTTAGHRRRAGPPPGSVTAGARG